MNRSGNTGCPFPLTVTVTLWLRLLFYLFFTLPKPETHTQPWHLCDSVAFQPGSPTLHGCRELLCPQLIHHRLHELPGTRGGAGQEGKNPTPCLAHTAGRQSRAAASYSCTWQLAGLNPSHPQQPAVDTAPLSTASLQPGCSTWLSKKATPASCTCSA